MGKETSIYLSMLGLIFPANSEELEAFENVHRNHEFFLSKESIDPYKILNRYKESSVISKIPLSRSQSFFRRSVLAAKIAHEYHLEQTFGIVKFQKLVYLCEQISDMTFASDYRKQAAGPMDYKFKHSIKAEFEKRDWFSVEQVGEYRKWVFTPRSNMMEYEKYYLKYFRNVSNEIQYLIDTFRTRKTEDVELIATLYECVLESRRGKEIVSDKLLMRKLYSWNESKLRFSELKIIETLRWMENNRVYPQ